MPSLRNRELVASQRELAVTTEHACERLCDEECGGREEREAEDELTKIRSGYQGSRVVSWAVL